MATVAAPITAEEFAKTSAESDVPMELVRGEIVEMNRPGTLHGFVCARIARLLGNWADAAAIGFVIANDAGVVTRRNPDSVRGPDVYFIRRARVPGGRLPDGWMTVPPDLCVEVLSPNDRWQDVLDKIGEYLRFGVPLAWVVDPEERQLYVYRSDAAPRILNENDVLADETTLPGFSITVSELFG